MAGETVRFCTSPVDSENETSLTTLIHRLEAATSRLEDIASSAEPFDSSHPPASRRGTSAGTALPSGDPQQRSNRGSDVTMKETLPPAIKEMDTLLETEVKAFTSASQVLDTAVAEQVRQYSLAWRCNCAGTV